jgi:5-methylcytosine-specific restriction enzyme subunit McrC
LPLTYIATEHALLRRITDFSDAVDSVAEVFLPDVAFEALKKLALSGQAENILTYFVQRGHDTLRLGQYVGLLDVAGVRLAIIPKVGDLPKMLRYLRQTPFRALPSAHSESAQMPLWEVFVAAFLDTVEPLIRGGLQSAFVTVEQNNRFMNGRFQPARHLRQNLFHAERIAVAANHRTQNTAPNRILKTTLNYLLLQTTSTQNQLRLRRAMGSFETVAIAENLAADWQTVRSVSRQFWHYTDALMWAEALLNQQTPGLRPGQQVSLSLLFPMQRVFESYVAAGFRRYWPHADEVSTQESSAYLIDNHRDNPTVKLRPDILIRQTTGQTLVIDTKWKIINGAELGEHLGAKNYGIAIADLYQLYAYGKKYGATDLFLIYPANDTFREPLPMFSYDADTRLHVVPIDVTEPLADEITRFVKRYG